MKAMVIYDSQYGNTAHIAQAIAEGLRGTAGDAPDVDLRKVGDVGFFVKGTEGPLEDGAIERAKMWARQIVTKPGLQ